MSDQPWQHDHAPPPSEGHLLGPPRLCEDREHEVGNIVLVFVEIDVYLQGGIH